MFLNSDNKKLVEYLEIKKIDNLKKTYLQFLEMGNKIEKRDFKNLLKNIRFDNEDKIKSDLLQIFLKNNISIFEDAKKSSSKERVKKFRDKNKKAGFKNLSLLLSSEDYKKIKNLKKEKNMTYSQLISFFLNS